ncbi:hypothetical protein [Halobacterium bonnevillei]|uniref:Glycosyltransferase RgtA/B/C/D-like domain-containing protein n=1 Tax=Halobacterium bonnevillei TaxID=2692200 RepID=A0A6B0SF73_9EURY|nr:hypothetical protein [Halobacterium bonnevillei]MXR19617.1 hypothetical protein [Halobacterium bonnevillei]
MSTTDRVRKLALLAGSVALTVAVLAAHNSPAAAYELSIYASTPAMVWGGVAAAFLSGALVAFTARVRSGVWAAAVGLVGGATLTVFGLPLLRGYEFYGVGDSLSHVGWAREIAAGAHDPTNLLYPGVHSLTVFVGRVADVPMTQANMVVALVAIPFVFLLFVPLAAELIAATPRAYTVGLLVAALFVPINNVSVHPNTHPASQAILLFAFLLYLALAYTTGDLDAGRGDESRDSAGGRGDRIHRSAGGRGDSTASPWLVLGTGTGVLLVLASAAVVFVHPQQALNVALVFAAIAAVQFLARRFAANRALAAHRPLYVHTAVLLAVFFAWTPRFDRAQGAFTGTIESLVQSGPSAGGVVSQRSASLTVVGGSLPELFGKLFGVATVCSALAAGLLGVGLYRRYRDSDALVGYVGAGLVPVVGVFLVVLASNAGDMYFRYHGFIMVPVSILAAAALARARNWAAHRGAARAGAAIVVVLLLGLAPVGAVAIHPSPYVYQPTKHVTAAELDGFGSAFEYREDGVEFAGVRGGPRRFVDYHYGTERARTTLSFPGYRDAIPPGVFAAGNYTDAFGDPRYIVLTERDYEREVGLYGGFRHPESGFSAFETAPGVNHVRTSDGVDVYVVREDDA